MSKWNNYWIRFLFNFRFFIRKFKEFLQDNFLKNRNFEALFQLQCLIKSNILSFAHSITLTPKKYVLV